jgi:hypothetical protein
MYNVQNHGVLHNSVVLRATLHATLFAGLHYMRRCSQDYITCDVVHKATLHARVGILITCRKHLHDHENVKMFHCSKKHVVLAYDKISITGVFPLTEHKMILFNDLSSLHFTRKCEDSKRVYRRHTLKY